MIDEGNAAAISIRAVTKRAGVSPTAFYLHFQSRDELIRACLELCFADFRDALRAAAAGIEDPRERLLGAGRAYIEFAREHPERYALIFGAAPLPPERSSGFSGQPGRPVGPAPEAPEQPGPLAPASDAFQDLVTLVLDHLAAGDPRREEADTLATGIWSGLHGFVMLRRARPAVGWPSDSEFAVRLASAWLGDRT